MGARPLPLDNGVLTQPLPTKGANMKKRKSQGTRVASIPLVVDMFIEYRLGGTPAGPVPFIVLQMKLPPGPPPPPATPGTAMFLIPAVLAESLGSFLQLAVKEETRFPGARIHGEPDRKMH